MRSIKHLKKTTDLEMPDGVVVTLRQPRLGVILKSGKLPDVLFSEALQSAAKGGDEAEMAEAISESDVEFESLYDFAEALAADALVWPRIVKEADPESDDELDSVPFEWVAAIFKWWRGGSKGMPVKAGGAEVTQEDLSSFRPNGELPGGSQSSAEIRPASVEAA